MAQEETSSMAQEEINEELSMAGDLLNKLEDIFQNNVPLLQEEEEDEFKECNIPDNNSEDDEDINIKIVCGDDYLCNDADKKIDSPIKFIKNKDRKTVICDVSKKIPAYYDSQDHYGLNLTSYMPPFFPFNVNQVMCASRQKYISKSEMCMNIILNELKQIFRLDSCEHFTLLPIDTIFDLRLTFNKGRVVVIDFFLDNMTYPFSPPQIQVHECGQAELCVKLATLDILSLDIWRSTHGIIDVMIAIGNILGIKIV
jgi:hypothetical protein